jgi:hypothetical protein
MERDARARRRLYFPVMISSSSNNCKASFRLVPQKASLAWYEEQTAGRSAFPYRLHRLSPVSCMHRTPGGFPADIPGILDEMDGAMQHAPHPARQETSTSFNFCIGYF